MSHAMADSATMLRRNLKHALRYPSVSLSTAVVPIIFLLLFVYVFGGEIGAGISGHGAGRGSYVNYLAPGIIVMTVASACVATAVSVCTDMSEGIIARFRTMAISRAAVLTGHVAGSIIQTMVSVVLVTAVALLAGFRPAASPAGWIGAIGVLIMVSLALTWLSAAIGLWAKNPVSASNIPIPLAILPMLGSGFVPAGSMPAGLRWFAQHQPFTPIIDTLRALLAGTPVGDNAIVAAAWCVPIAAVSYLWARTLYQRDPSR
jgi:ABC-2 type transport system permease protein